MKSTPKRGLLARSTVRANNKPVAQNVPNKVPRAKAKSVPMPKVQIKGKVAVAKKDPVMRGYLSKGS